MLPLSILVFPIVGGYYVLSRSKLFRYRQIQLGHQKLIFNAFLCGIVLLIVSWAITILVNHIAPAFTTWLRDHYPLPMQYFGTCLLAFVIAILSTEITNIFVSEEDQLTNAVRAIGNELERLCEKSYRNMEFIQITLKNDKCYIGWILDPPIPNYSNYISVFPIISGFRSRTRKKLSFTTSYLEVYAECVRDGLVYDIRDVTQLTIKIDDIITASPFDFRIYERFEGNKPIAMTSNKKSPA